MNKEIRNHLMSIIPKGKDRAISMHYLASLLRTNEREARRVVMEARIKGMLIIGDKNGYYRPETQEELRAYYRSVMSRQKKTAMSVAAARRRLNELGNHHDYKQMSLFDRRGIT